MNDILNLNVMEKIKSRTVLTPDKTVQYVDAKDFLRIIKTKRDMIESVVYVRSRLGSGEFGKYKVEFGNGY